MCSSFRGAQGQKIASIARSLWEAFESRSLTDALQHKQGVFGTGASGRLRKRFRVAGLLFALGTSEWQVWADTLNFKALDEQPDFTCHTTNPKHDPARILLRAPRAGDPGPCQLLDTQPGLFYILVPRRNLVPFRSPDPLTLALPLRFADSIVQDASCVQGSGASNAGQSATPGASSLPGVARTQDGRSSALTIEGGGLSAAQWLKTSRVGKAFRRSKHSRYNCWSTDLYP